MPDPDWLPRKAARVTPRRLQNAPRSSGVRGMLVAATGFVLTAAAFAIAAVALWRLDGAPLPPAAAEPAPVAEVAAAPPAERAPPNPSGRADRAGHSSPQQGRAAPAPLPSRADVAEPTNAEPAADPPPADRRDPAEPSPATTARFLRAVNQARAALVGRDLERAEKHLTQADQEAQSAAERARVKQLRTLAAEVRRYFDVVRIGMSKFEPTDEIRVDDWFAVVVERGPESLSLFDEGSRRDYTIATLPAQVARIMAKAGADEQNPQIKLALAAFEIVDRKGNRDTARRLLKEAAAAGENVDDLASFAEGVGLVVTRDPVPAAGVIESAGGQLEREFAEAIAASKSSAQKSDLAVKWLATSESSLDPAEQYVLLDRGRDMAIAAADPRLAVQMIDELARWFEVDSLELKADAFGKLAAAPLNPTSARFIARRAIELADECARQKRDELVAPLADAGLAAARKSRDAELVKRVTEQRRELSGGQKKKPSPKK